MEKDFKDYKDQYQKTVLDIRKLNIEDYAQKIENLKEVMAEAKESMKANIDNDNAELEEHNREGEQIIKNAKDQIKELKAGLEENEAQLQENRQKQEKLKTINLVNIRKNVDYLYKTKLAQIDEDLKVKEDIIKEKEQKVEELKNKNREEHNLTDEEIKTLQDTMIEAKELKEKYQAEQEQSKVAKDNVQNEYDEIIASFDEFDKTLELPLTEKEDVFEEVEEPATIEEEKEEVEEPAVTEEKKEEVAEEPEKLEEKIDIKNSKKLIKKVLEGVPENIEFYYLPEENKKYIYDKKEDIIYEIKKEDTAGYIYCYDLLNKMDMVYDVKNNEFKPAEKEEEKKEEVEENDKKPQPTIVVPPPIVNKEPPTNQKPKQTVPVKDKDGSETKQAVEPAISKGSEDIKPTRVMNYNVKRDAHGVTINGKFVSYDEINYAREEKFNKNKEAVERLEELILKLSRGDKDSSGERKIFIDRKIIYAAQALKEKDDNFDLIGFAEEYNNLVKEKTGETAEESKMNITYDLKLKLKDIFRKDIRAHLESVKEAAFEAKKYANIKMRGITALKFKREWRKEQEEEKAKKFFPKSSQKEERASFVSDLEPKEQPEGNVYANAKTTEEMFELFEKRNKEAEDKFNEAVGIDTNDRDDSK